MDDRDVVGELRQFLDEFLQVRAAALRNLTLGVQMRDRVVARLERYLQENVSDDEAKKVAVLGLAVDPLRDEVEVIDDAIAYLEALIADVLGGHSLPTRPSTACSPMSQELARLALHPRVTEVAGQLFSNGHYRQAILDTYIALVEGVRRKSELALDNTPLMQQAFSPERPRLRVSSDKDEQLGFMWLFSGAVMAIRNPKAHRLLEQADPGRTLEWLCFASVLFRTLDECTATHLGVAAQQ
jgi:uncharacterized protein (TIGR02391 family)